ncbi:PREDICTED: lipid transfer-like protein VAS [Ipomoea nil]|uniref:lipid transfer-like protein VAS n=1 Tax=Ipomoea nil TaxID=35883 RepID=UPI000901172E|nr:PREDICTED: lipid transfer-like protein VAS [Ipomoea nil]
MGCGKVSTAMMMVAVVVMAAAAMTTEAQQVPSCAMQLIPCAGFLNATTKPPSSCCDPLKEAVTKELPCLCNLFKDQNLMKGLNINVTQALELPKLCGIPGDISACNAPSPGASPSTSPGASPSIPPPATPGGDHNNGVAGGTPAIAISSLLVMAAAMLF